MLDLKSQSQLAEAAADMMRTCAIATARAATSSMFQSLSFWSRMLGPVPAFPASPWPPAWSYAGVLPTQPPHATGPEQSPEPAVHSAFASYRSAGGHAAAQVIVS